MSKITFIGGGGGGGGAGVSDHGALAGLADDDHSQYLLTNGNRVAAGLAVTSGIEPATSGGATVGYTELPFVSGVFERVICVGGSPTLDVGFESNGGDFNVIAGNGNQTNLQANTITAGAAGLIRWTGRARFDSPIDGDVNLMASDGATSGNLALGNLYAETQIYISGISVGDKLGAGGGAADFSAIAEPMLPDTSGIRDVGSFTKVWASGFFDGIVLADSDSANTYWKLTVDSGGTLTTTQVT